MVDNSLLFSGSTVTDALQPHGLHHTRLLCWPLSPGVCSNFCPLSQPCSLTTSSSVAPFSFAFNLSQRQSLFQWVSSLYWNFSFSTSPSKEYSRLISFRIDWFDLLAVQGTCKSPFLQQHNLKASILWHPAFFTVQLSHRTWLLE